MWLLHSEMFVIGIQIFCYFYVSCLYADTSSNSPLILTPYLEENDVKTARQLAKVTPDIGNVTSYSGFFKVEKQCDNNLFFWFFPALLNWTQAPVVLWLQGGPGSSSMYGLFELIGPFNSLPKGLESRNHSWANFSNLVFIDNPVGAGFSYTGKGCYPTTISTVTEQLFSALIQFFLLFPELQNNKLYLTGESFAGHYIPALALYIHYQNMEKYQINLAGIVIGNPLMKLDCHDYASYLYQLGIADDTLRDDIDYRQKQLKEHVNAKNYSAANDDWYYILNDLILNRTDFPSRYNIITEPEDPSNYVDFLSEPKVRNQIHVGNVNFSDINWDSYNNLINTIAEPRTLDVEKLLKTKKYFVVFYSGQLDIICMYASTVCIMRGLQWSGRNTYLNATRKIWYMEDKVVGWVKSADNMLCDVLVKDAGHSVPYYKSSQMFLMMSSIVSAKPGGDLLWKLDLNI